MNSPPSLQSAVKKKRNRKKENFSRNIHSLMKRMDKIVKKYNVDLYFCAKYDKYFAYTSSPSFAPRLEDIVSFVRYPFSISCTNI